MYNCELTSCFKFKHEISWFKVPIVNYSLVYESRDPRQKLLVIIDNPNDIRSTKMKLIRNVYPSLLNRCKNKIINEITFIDQLNELVDHFFSRLAALRADIITEWEAIPLQKLKTRIENSFSHKRKAVWGCAARGIYLTNSHNCFGYSLHLYSNHYMFLPRYRDFEYDLARSTRLYEHMNAIREAADKISKLINIYKNINDVLTNHEAETLKILKVKNANQTSLHK